MLIEGVPTFGTGKGIRSDRMAAMAAQIAGLEKRLSSRTPTLPPTPFATELHAQEEIQLPYQPRRVVPNSISGSQNDQASIISVTSSGQEQAAEALEAFAAFGRQDAGFVGG